MVYLCGGPFNPHSGALHQWRHIRPSHIFHESAYSYRAVRAFKFFDISRRISLKSPHKECGELSKSRALWGPGRGKTCPIRGPPSGNLKTKSSNSRRCDMNKTSSEKLFLKNFPMCSRDEHIGVYEMTWTHSTASSFSLLPDNTPAP